jgi:hypothetical protein
MIEGDLWEKVFAVWLGSVMGGMLIRVWGLTMKITEKERRVSLRLSDDLVRYLKKEREKYKKNNLSVSIPTIVYQKLEDARKKGN